MVDPADRRRLSELAPPDAELVRAAAAARERAHAPYSGYRVGAAVRTHEGEIRHGCNIEISSYGLTICAERVALFAARASGAGQCAVLAVVGRGREGRPTPPCGACRQVLIDLAPEARVLLATPEGEIEEWRAADLLPRAFGPEYLDPPGGANR